MIMIMIIFITCRLNEGRGCSGPLEKPKSVKGTKESKGKKKSKRKEGGVSKFSSGQTRCGT